MSRFRGFIAVDIDASSSVVEFGRDIRSSGANVKLVEPENVHITLKFLGDVEEDQVDDIEKAMRDSVKDIEPFKIKLIGTGVFPNQRNVKVIWVGVENGKYLEEIAGNIDERLSHLGFKKEKRGFSSHLTVARVKTARNKDALLKTIGNYADTEFGVQEVKSIKLKKSVLTPQGPIYSTVREVEL
jgi:2'-5' RNA ligase